MSEDRWNGDLRCLRIIHFDAGLGLGKIPDAVPKVFDLRYLTGGATLPLRVSTGFGRRKPSFEEKTRLFLWLVINCVKD